MPELKRIEVACAIIWRDGRFLAARRPEIAPFGGYWEFPGGKLEAGEKPEEALCRELEEELGILPLEYEYLGAKVHFYEAEKLEVALRFFNVASFAGQARPKEGQTLEWMSPAQAREASFLPADAEFIANMNNLDSGACQSQTCLS